MAGRNLSYAPWLVRDYRGLLGFISPLTTQALAAWDRLNTKLALAPPVSPLAPLWRGGGSVVPFWGTGVIFLPQGG